MAGWIAEIYNGENRDINTPAGMRGRILEDKMQIEKISDEVSYKISEGQYHIQVTITDGKALYIANCEGKGEFNFVDSKPEVVAAVGRMLIAASELVK